MKKKTRALIILSFLFIIVGSIGAVLTYAKAYDSIYVTQQETISINGIKKINLTGSSATIQVAKTHAKELSVKIEGLDTNATDYQLSSSKKGDQLNLAIKEHKQRSNTVLDFLQFENVRITLEIPESIDLLAFDTTAGRVSIDHLALSDVIITTDSGDVSVAESQLANLSIQTSAGTTYLNQSTIQKVAVDSDSGSTYFNEVIAKETAVTTDSGQIDFSQVAGNLSAQADTGTISLANHTLNQETAFTTHFGTIYVTTKQLPSDLLITTSTNLGSVSLFDKSVPTAQFGEGSHSMKLKTDTGDISVLTEQEEEFENN